MARIDIVCSVVDNFGDAGFCWRLARQLAREHRIGVRVWTDRQDLFERLARGDEPARAAALDLAHAGIEVGPIEALDACIEPDSSMVTLFDAFGVVRCTDARGLRIHPRSMSSISVRSPGSTCHDSHSLRWTTMDRSPGCSLPGFSAASGGARSRARPGQTPRVLPGEPQACMAGARWRFVDARIATLFAYQAAPSRIGSRHLGARADGPCWLLATVRTASRLGGVEIVFHRFLAQPAFDELLWASDFAFVRGEDSWIRAPIGPRIPFVWAPYRQSDRLHLKKLDAFLDRFLDASAADDPASAAAIRAVSHAWSEDGDIDQAWRAYRERLESIAALHRVWTDTLAARTDLASNLMTMLRSRANC
ncbi:MAG: elongation factor P maturation arginine rhamnosyltransferase EarP [Burkholderiaceae bacterium]